MNKPSVSGGNVVHLQAAREARSAEDAAFSAFMDRRDAQYTVIEKAVMPLLRRGNSTDEIASMLQCVGDYDAKYARKALAKLGYLRIMLGTGRGNTNRYSPILEENTPQDSPLPMEKGERRLYRGRQRLQYWTSRENVRALPMALPIKGHQIRRLDRCMARLGW
jgi:hypothetical protein